MTGTGINAVIHGKFQSVSFHDVGSGYTYFPAYDTVIENVSVEDLGETDGCVVRGEQLQVEMNGHFTNIGDEEFFDTLEEAKKEWRSNSIEAVYNTNRRFRYITKWPFITMYREDTFIGWRVKQGWVTKQETLPVQVQIPINVPLVSYTEKVIPVSPKRGLLEE